MSEETRTEQRNMAVSCCKGATVALDRRAKQSEVLTSLTLGVCPSHHTHQLVETGITTGAPYDVKEVKRCITATRSTDKGLQGGAPHLMPEGLRPVQDEAIGTAELTPLCNSPLDSLSLAQMRLFVSRRAPHCFPLGAGHGGVPHEVNDGPFEARVRGHCVPIPTAKVREALNNGPSD